MSLFTRNIRYAVRHPVRTYKVRKACKAHVDTHPVCAWCGSTKKVEAHHIVPLWKNESLGSDPTNFISLCRPRRCHLLVGHNGNFGYKYVDNVAQICTIKEVIERQKDPKGEIGAVQICVA